MLNANELVGVGFSGLAPLVVEEVADEGEVIRVRARTPGGPADCPDCGGRTGRVHAFHERTVTDVPVDARRVVVPARLRRLVCPTPTCPRITFREQVPGVSDRYQRWTVRLLAQVRAVVRELAGRAGARTLEPSGPGCRGAPPCALAGIPLPARPVPRGLGVDDFALKRRHRYATVPTDAETGERLDVLPGRGAHALEAWLPGRPGVEIVCRDGSGAYAEAIRRALPDVIQVPDRWHSWRNPCDKTLAEVRSHSSCRATVNPPRPGGIHAQTTRERRHTGSFNLLHRHLTQGRAEGDRPVTAPRRFARILLTRPDNRREKDTDLIRDLLTAACPETTQLQAHIAEFASLLAPAQGNDTGLTAWITAVRASDLPHLHAFANGLELDRAAVDATLTTPHHNGRTEGVNTRTKRITRQMHGRAGFDLLRHRILLP